MDDIFDLTIIGGGPSGLYAAYYAGFRGLKVKIVDSLEELGGQVTALYPEKYIYDVAGFPKILAKDLVRNLVEQAFQYHPTCCLNERTERIHLVDKMYEIVTQKNRHKTRSILLTTGVGVFKPKPIPVRGVERFEGKGLAYFVPDIKHYAGKNVLIVGGGNSAVDWALNLEPLAAAITLVHRRDVFRAHERSVEQLKASTVKLKLFYEVKELRGTSHVETAVLVNNKTQAENVIPVEEVLACLGFESTVGPLAQWGLQLDANMIVVNTRMETNLLGIYAAGDVATYPGKVKLISSGFGEAAIAVNHAATFLNPGTRLSPGHSSNQSR
ncbi:MAG: NAD(P)/FAD-dependent oxidoreductase [Elusimicrobiota bacterium]|jgi:thioredoxin reductase (NADPH)